MTAILFGIMVLVIMIWYVLMEIHQDTTFNWQMQKEIFQELVEMRKMMAERVEKIKEIK